jgi:hypothetical protein
LALGALSGLSGCGVAARAIREGLTGMASPGPRNLEWSKVAWQYFRTARNSGTGLAEAIAGAGFAMTSTIGDQIAAAVCAYRLGAIDQREFDVAVSQLLQFLAGMPLSGGELPARFYDTSSGQLIDPPEEGRDPGWSAVDLGRLLVWLRILGAEFRQYAAFVARIVERWDLCVAVDPSGRMLRKLPGDGGMVSGFDLGSGYEVYGAQGLRAWGLEVTPLPPSAGEFSLTVEGVEFAIGTDADPLPRLLTVPYALLGIEFGWSKPEGGSLAQERAQAERLFMVQQRRSARTGIATARSDFRRTSEPYAVADSILAGGTPWSTLAPGGASRPDLALISTKAAFAMWALGSSGSRPMESVGTLRDASTGWFEGRYEASGGYEWTRTAATNAMVLEALLYREVGTLFPSGAGDALVPGSGAGIACNGGDGTS